ncbi:LysR family transcriptional regulator [Pelagibacterium flavum]|uniref:LysR family transcriptional regulator n=1 Tax=Pelagibacterium flavum TaxID=2984530 RepID=A0ABY6ISC1_9HYPH|nr:LysR family transcriptional regulator [Pelagibacterium sp. YIM 151497]UYQ73531.1 LysR family transcriptional regulator [Pelagibacterium sp. YIM 151497]
MLNERDLRYFIGIVEHGNVHRAAESLHITQPALSKCIRRMEDLLQAPLFERHGRSLVLTDVGRQLASRAQHIVRGMDEVYKETLDYAHGMKGHIRIGAAATVAEFMMPEVLRMTNEHMPDVTLEISVGMSDVLREALLKDNLDLVLGPTSNSEDFDCQPIVEDRVVVVASKDHPLVGQSVDVAQLCGYQWVLAARPVKTREWIDAVFSSRSLPPPRAKIEVNTLVQLPQLIYQSSLLSFVSHRNLEKPEVAEKISEIDVPSATLNRHFGILTRKASYLPQACKKLCQFLVEHGKDI